MSLAMFVVPTTTTTIIIIIIIIIIVKLSAIPLQDPTSLAWRHTLIASPAASKSGRAEL